MFTNFILGVVSGSPINSFEAFQDGDLGVGAFIVVEAGGGLIVVIEIIKYDLAS